MRNHIVEPWTRIVPFHVAPYVRHALWGRQANQKVGEKTKSMLSLASAEGLLVWGTSLAKGTHLVLQVAKISGTGFLSGGGH